MGDPHMPQETGQPAGQGPLAVALAVCAMLAFAANSLLARLAFQTTIIDPATFTFVRLACGAGVLWLLVLAGPHGRRPGFKASWASAVLLFVYAAAFSFAYRGIDTGAGALVLFACAQLTMILYGVARGERTNVLGLLLATGGLIAFLAPGASAPPLLPALLMALAGIAWGGFSLLGRGSNAPVGSTASSFIWAVPLAGVLLFASPGGLRADGAGLGYAALSGALASALGYAIWYWVRVRMTAIAAGSLQLSVPVLSALLGMLVLGEHLALRSWLAGAVVLLGVVITTRSSSLRQAQPQR
ncbi:DMT family transporter [Pandoraea communis]|nr:DMT family transporter [Pandoraea communis]MDM8355045.1 DMT family transporter [Pandoraea communis]